MRVDGATYPELIQQQGARHDLAADADCQRVTLTGIHNPMVAEMHKWDGSHVSFLSKTERTCAEHGNAKPG